MSVPLKEATSGASRAVGSFREAVQDLLVPELRAMKVSIDALTQEMRLRNEQVTQELRLRTDKLQEELRLRTDKLQEEVRLRTDKLQEEMRMRDANLHEELRMRDEQQKASMVVLSQKLDTALDVRERLIALEARLPRLQ